MVIIKPDVEMILVHDGEKWVARNEVFTVAGRTLAELDKNLAEAVSARGEFHKGSKITVFIGFDFNTIPRWIRQYAAHYFNRSLSIKI